MMKQTRIISHTGFSVAGWKEKETLIGAAILLLLLACTQQLATAQSTIPAFPGAEGAGAHASGGRLLVNGHSTQGSNHYVIIRRSDGVYAQTRGFDQHYWPGGDLRNDPAPCWNRDSTQILIPVIAGFPPQQTRQLFLLKLKGV